MTDYLDQFYTKYLDRLVDFGIHVLEAVAILVIGFWLTKLISRYLYFLMVKRDVDSSSRIFLKDIFQITLNVFVVVIAINTAGIKVTSILALIGGAAVGVGLGLQGSFSNFAGGVMIILTKPFKIGDLIQSGENIGFVEKINLLNSTIRSPRNELIVMPNAPLFNNPLSNYSSKKAYRTDITVGVEYKSDVHRLKPLLKEKICQHEMFMQNKTVTVEIEQFTTDRINLTVRAFSNPRNYFDAPLILHGIAKDVIEANGFVMPVAPQEIKIIHENESTQRN